MSRNLRGYAVRSSGNRVTFLASSDIEARDGLVIESGSWQLENYRKNPVILWSHRYDQPPIGRATRIEETSRGLEVDIEFDTDSGDAFAASIAKKVAAGFLNAVSVGFDILRQVGNRVTETELFEVSVVPVPADPTALAMARSRYGGSSRSLDSWWSGSTTSGKEKKGLTRRDEAELALGLARLSPQQRDAMLSDALRKEALVRDVSKYVRLRVAIDAFRALPRKERDAIMRKMSPAQLKILHDLLPSKSAA